jgi:hypothetical protein
VVLVRKSYEDRRRRRRQKGAAAQRPWRLKRLPMATDGDEEDAAGEKQKQHRGRGVSTAEQEQADMERFMQVGGAGWVRGVGVGGHGGACIGMRVRFPIYMDAGVGGVEAAGCALQASWLPGHMRCCANPH